MRTIIVHTLEQATAALKAAAELNLPVALQSASDALFYAGSLYLRDMFAQAQAACPGAQATFVLDCADARGEAVAAIHDGHMAIRSSAPQDVQEKLAGIARQSGSELLEDKPEMLDLRHARDPQAACRNWLTRH